MHQTTILFWTQTRLPLQGTSGQVNTDEIEKENAPVKWSAN